MNRIGDGDRPIRLRVQELEEALAREAAERMHAEALLRLQYRIADALRVASDPETALAHILDALMDIDTIDCGGVYTSDYATGGLRLRVHRGLSAEFIEVADAYAADSANVALARRGKVVYGRHADVASAALPAAVRQEGIRALAVIPLVHNGHVAVVLNLGSHTADDIPLSVRTMIEAVGAQIAEVVALMEAGSALRERERDLDTLFDSIDDFLFVLDAEGRILRINRAVQQRLGYSEAELAGQPVLSVHPADRRDEAARIVGEMLAGATKTCLVPIQAKSGELVPVETRVMPGEWGGKPALFGVSRDVTQREAAALELRTERDFARIVMDTMAQGLTVTNAAGRFEYVNPAYARMMGYRPEQLIGRSPAEFTAPEDRNALAKARLEREAGRTTTYETRLVRADGQFVPVTITGVPRGRLGNVAGTIATITDLSSHKRAEELRLALELQAQQAQKRSSLGTMAAGIAHHFNNLLTVILGNIDLALADGTMGPAAIAELNAAALAGKRAAAISEVMLTYVGQRIHRDQFVPLTQGVERIVALVRASVPWNVRLEADLPAAGPTVRIDPDQLEQVVVNLVTNASEAIGAAAGSISLAIRVLEDQSVACLEVRDTGHGMDLATQARIFDPFFTTRMMGRGLGLAVTLGIVQAHRGTIDVESAPGRGTTIRVRLPVEPDAER